MNRLLGFGMILLLVSGCGLFGGVELDTPNKRLAAAALQYEAGLDAFIFLRSQGVIADEAVPEWADQFGKARMALDIWRAVPADISLQNDAMAQLQALDLALRIIQQLLINAEATDGYRYNWHNGLSGLDQSVAYSQDPARAVAIIRIE